MSLSTCAAPFFAGVFLCNALPHLAAGLQGRLFPTPFAKPRGVGDSSPLVNVYWGLFNLLVAAFCLDTTPVVMGFNTGFFCALFGAACLGSYLAVHFGKVQARKASR